MCSYPTSQISLIDTELFDGVAVLATDESGTILEWNATCEKLTGYSADKIGQKIDGLFTEGDFPELSFGEPAVIHTELLTHSGNSLPVMVKLFPADHVQGGYSVLIVSIENSDYHNLKQSVEEKSEKLTEMESFHRQVIHDLRAPLRAIIGYGKIIHEEFGGKCNPEGLRMLEAILVNGEKAQRYIEDLRKVMQVGSVQLHPEACDVSKILSSIVEDKTMRNRVKVQSTVPVLPEILADKELIHEAMREIIDNAFKYRNDTGILEIDVYGKEEGRNLLLIIRDNGIGFDQRFAKEVFQVYRKLQADNINDGGGIGLTLAKKIIDKHKGKIWIESAVGQGTSVFVKLPKAKT